MQADVLQPPVGSYIVGPLLVSSSLSWALWGVLTAQLIFLVRDVRRRRKANEGSEREDLEKHGKNRFGFRRKNANASKSTFGDEDVNPWRKSFAPPLAVPSISAYPSQSHARQRSSKNVPSFDPYSPTAAHPSPLDTDAHSMILPTQGNVPATHLTSLYLLLTLYALYVFVCVRLVLGTAQFWRVSVKLWGTGSPILGPRWMGIVLADCIGPIIFLITAMYFIYALYFSPMRSATITRPALRPLSLLKAKPSVNVLPEPYLFPFPQSPTSTSHSNPKSSRSVSWRRVLRPDHAVPGLLALLTVVVTVCGFVDCARSFKETPLGTPMELNAVALIWAAGMLALDLLLCVLLCRALGPRLIRGSWMARILLVMGEAGGTQLVVALIALVLMVSWRDGKPPSTLTMVAPALLPAIYANTVLLHASSSYWRSCSHEREKESSSTPSRDPSRAGVAAKFEDIEMSPRSGMRRPTTVDLVAATAGSTLSTTDSSGEGRAALREQALAYGREREREKDAASRMHLERDTIGEGSSDHLPKVVPGGANNEGEKAKAQSVRSGVSGAISLELPTFRKGRGRWRYRSAYGYPGYPVDEESGSEAGSDPWDDELEMDLDSEEGGTWDYGFANTEREKERDRVAATLLAGASTNDAGTRISVQGGTGNRWQNLSMPAGKRSSYPSRPASWRRSLHTRAHPLAKSISGDGDEAAEGDEDDDKVSMLSGVSTTRSRRRTRHSYNAASATNYPQNGYFAKSKPLRLLPRTPSTLPPMPTSAAASASTDSVFLTGTGAGNGLGSPAGSVLVIGRGGVPREPSIAEGSVDRAASVAATRASTGSMWSTFSYHYPFGHGHGHGHEYAHGYSYPRPVQLPDLDMDLQHGAVDEEGAEVEEKARGEQEENLGEVALGSFSGGAGARKDSPHPYSAAGAAVGEGTEDSHAARRRLNVHPLRRLAEMGRLRF